MRTTLLAVAMALVISILPVSAQAVQNSYQLSIPRQPLDAALKDLAKQTGVQIARFSDFPHGAVPIVGPVSGDLSVGQALTAILRKTGLTYRVVNDRTIAVVAPGGGTAESVSATASKQVTDLSQGASGSGDGANGNKAFWSTFLAAQAAQADQGGASSSATENQQNQQRSKQEPIIQEVIVTAQKREERLQDVPISVSVLTGADLDRSTGQGVFDELNRVPGVVVVPPSLAGSTSIAIRGVSAGGVVVNGASPIAYYLDTVPFGFVRSALIPDSSAFDLQRVEVLRGPQGTLYGANAEDGVVRVLTNDADLNGFDLKAHAFGSGTDSGGANGGGDVAINVPIIDGKVAVRGVVDYQNLSGWIDRPAEKDANDAQLRNYRLKINAQPTDGLTVGLSLWSSRDHFGAMSTSLSDRTAPNSDTTPEPVENDFDSYGLKLGYQFSSFAVTSQTSYLSYTSYSAQNLTPYGGFYQAFDLNAIVDLSSRVFSEELLLNSTDDSSMWRWTGGAFYRDDDDHFDQLVAPLNILFDFKDKSRSYAFFGQLGRRFLDRKLEFTVGLRQFHDEVSTIKVDPTPPPYSVSQSFNATTPKAVLSWYPVSSFTAYASFSEGFRSGMPQYYTIAEVRPDLGALKPDKLYNYEIGAKGDFLQHRLSIDTAVYYVNWHDVQQSIYVPFSGGVILAQVNGQNASGPGVDLSVTARPAAGLEVGGTFSWNDLTFDDAVFSGGQLLFSKGDRLNNSSEYTASLFGKEQFPLGHGFSGEVSASANYTSRQSTRTYGINYPAYGDNLIFLNASLSLFFPAHWSVQIFGDNLTNEYGAIVAPPQGYAPTAVEFTPRPRPRTVGLQVDYRFK